MALRASHRVNSPDWSFASILKRHVRERHVTRREMTAILKDFEEDAKSGVWQWFGVTSELLKKTCRAVLDLPSTVFVQSGDALHLASAEEHGFQEVYTNDRHMLQAAKHFHVTGVNVLSESNRGIDEQRYTSLDELKATLVTETTKAGSSELRRPTPEPASSTHHVQDEQ